MALESKNPILYSKWHRHDLHTGNTDFLSEFSYFIQNWAPDLPLPHPSLSPPMASTPSSLSLLRPQSSQCSLMFSFSCTLWELHQQVLWDQPGDYRQNLSTSHHPTQDSMVSSLNDAMNSNQSPCFLLAPSVSFLWSPGVILSKIKSDDYTPLLKTLQPPPISPTS